MTVRSTKLGAAHLALNTYLTLFTPPTGWRAIVKSFQLDNSGGPATTVTVIIQNQSPAINVNAAVISLGGNSTYEWQGWVVMNPTDNLVFYSSLSAIDIWASGTLLQLTGQEPL